MSEIAKAYEPKEVEQRWYANWLEAGCFKGVADPAKEPYAIMIPPPNVTGKNLKMEAKAVCLAQCFKLLKQADNQESLNSRLLANYRSNITLLR